MAENIHCSVTPIKVQKKICKVIFDDKDQYEDVFAKELCKNGFKVLEAFQTAMYQVNKIRASYMLQNISVWVKIFLALKEKPDPSPKEKEWLFEFQRCVEQYDLNPFELYQLYVSINQNTGKPIIHSLGSDQVKDIQILIYLHHFFTVIHRPKFVSEIKLRIKSEYDNISPPIEKDIKVSLSFFKKKFDIDIEEIITSSLNYNNLENGKNDKKRIV